MQLCYAIAKGSLRNIACIVSIESHKVATFMVLWMEPAVEPPEDISDIPADVPTSSGQTFPAKVPLENIRMSVMYYYYCWFCLTWHPGYEKEDEDRAEHAKLPWPAERAGAGDVDPKP